MKMLDNNTHSLTRIQWLLTYNFKVGNDNKGRKWETLSQQVQTNGVNIIPDIYLNHFVSK